MTRRTTAIAAALSLLPLGQPLLLGSTTTLATAVVMFSTQAAHAQSASTYVDAGIEKGKSGDLQEAIADFNKALIIDAQSASAYYYRGSAKVALGDHQGAIADFNKALAINPQYADAYRTRGITKELIDDLTGACADWRKASSLGVQEAAGWVKDQCQ